MDRHPNGPSGFWGFRHVIEQPLSTVETNALATVVAGDAPATIVVEGGRPVELLNAYSRNLASGEDHRRELQALPFVRTTADFDLLKIGHALQRADLDVVYFYVVELFGNPEMFGWYAVGLGIGFFGYLVLALLLEGRNVSGWMGVNSDVVTNERWGRP